MPIVVVAKPGSFARPYGQNDDLRASIYGAPRAASQPPAPKRLPLQSLIARLAVAPPTPTKEELQASEDDDAPRDANAGCIEAVDHSQRETLPPPRKRSKPRNALLKAWTVCTSSLSVSGMIVCASL